MNELKLIKDVYKVQDAEGNILIEAPILDIYSTIGLGMATTTGDRKEKMKAAAQALNEEYGCDLSWGTVLMLLNDIDEAVENAKKNSTSMLESLIGME